MRLRDLGGLRLAGFLTLGLLVAGCATQTTRVGGERPFPPVPEPIPEIVPKPPVSAESLMWQPGYWDWTGAGYIWRPGLYVPAAGHGNLWNTGYWANRDGGWVWLPPHWGS